jgi:hypothetical protein
MIMRCNLRCSFPLANPCESGCSKRNQHRWLRAQGFNWECAQRPLPPWYAVLAGRAAEIAAAGITAVWLPPPSASVTAEVRRLATPAPMSIVTLESRHVTMSLRLATKRAASICCTL